MAIVLLEFAVKVCFLEEGVIERNVFRLRLVRHLAHGGHNHLVGSVHAHGGGGAAGADGHSLFCMHARLCNIDTDVVHHIIGAA